MNEETKQSLLNFFSKYPLKKYNKGEQLLKPNQDFGGVVFAKSGYIKVCTISNDGRETCVPLFKPLFYLSLVTELTGQKNKHFLEAITNVEAYAAPKADFVKFLNDNESIKNEVMSSFLKKFMDLTTGMLQIISGDAMTKIISLIYSLAGEFGVKKDKGRIIKFKLTHKLIASLTGLTRETVTLQMLKLHKKKLIANVKRQIYVQDYQGMGKILGY